jgi:hypothetical protein
VVIRRLVVSITLAAIVAACAATHHHAAFGPESETSSEDVVTTHNPLSTASHWHAILKILPVEPCWACHWSRVAGVPPTAAATGPVVTAGKLNALPPRSVISIARFTRRSRGPPDLS